VAPRMASWRDTGGVAHGPEPSWDCGGTAGVLERERARASFAVESMTYVLDGGKAETLRRRFISESTEDREGHAGSSSRNDLERNGASGGIAANFAHFMAIHKKHLDRFYVPKGHEMLHMTAAQSFAGYPGFGLWLTTLVGQCSTEQLGWWLPKAYTMQITGSYAQTELGHGSNVKGLETTADYDASTQEFVLNTPTLASMKWWPSNMATSTHCVLYAQLLIQGKEHGLHVFFLQLRDENLEPLPGVEVGDLGVKVGENEVDIGYLRMRDVRIPRRHMMEKRQHVEPDGTYVKHDLGGASNDKAAYLTMMMARTQMVAGASVFLAKGCTIAVRYNAVRAQGFKEAGKGPGVQSSYRAAEHRIIDYATNQYQLLKQTALAYAIRFTSKWLSARMEQLQLNPEDAGADLPEIHASAAGLKGYCCDAAAKGLEELRLTTGGAGYLMASGIAPLVADYKWRATAEGETNVMLLQTARYLVKSAADAAAGRALSGLTQCLAVLRAGGRPAPPRAVQHPHELLELPRLLAWLEYRTVLQVSVTKRALDQRLTSQNFDDAWAALSLRAVQTGQSHVIFFMLSKFQEQIEACEDAPCQAVLRRLAALFALADMRDGKQWTGLLDLHTADMVEEAIAICCAQLRPDMLASVEAWDFSDKALNSTIGSKDGAVYERQYMAAAASPSNRDKVPAFFDAIRPFLDKDFLALRNKPCEGCDPKATDVYPPARGEPETPELRGAKL
jgi:acyl-CoA oxidase